MTIFEKLDEAFAAYGNGKVPLWFLKKHVEENTFLRRAWCRELMRDAKAFSIFTTFAVLDEFAPISDDVIVRLENAQNH